MDKDTRKKLIDSGREDLVKISDINDSGYAGVMPNGNIVDRRENLEAIPVQKNETLSVPSPKPLLSPKNMVAMLKPKTLEIKRNEAAGQFLPRLGEWINSINWKAEHGIASMTVRYDQANNRLIATYKYLFDMQIRNVNIALSSDGSYYEDLGLELPVKAKVSLDYMAGMKFSIIWEDIPADNKENILYGWIGTEKKALEIIAKYPGWVLQKKK